MVWGGGGGGGGGGTELVCVCTYFSSGITKEFYLDIYPIDSLSILVYDFLSTYIRLSSS